MELAVAHKLYNRGLVYLDVPVSDDDCIALPPLDGKFSQRSDRKIVVALYSRSKLT